ncbi:hypothetical protein IU433_10230 [Nocardia puris]|uniref:hypothetical protein n=1 Tax=Nocardia puris TaxID=208602 RepID=UPI001893F46E|nr:hypothetical protein [Nocardia puris]MBF6364484.1 hypothetical protein [Nocardia puris]MBF6459413.1 hypothetical protein [Nocardia puris]
MTQGSSIDQSLAQWRGYKQKAESGEFKLDSQLGGALEGRCDTLLDGLRTELLRRATNLRQLSGFGELPSATALQSKFEKKADGDQDSAVNQLKKHIDLVILMRDTYKLATQKLADQDQSNANDLNNTDV